MSTRANRLTLICLIVVSWLFVSSHSSFGAQIDPRVLADTAEGKTARFLVIFNQQLSQRSVSIGGKPDDMRAAQLVHDLKSTAEVTQKKTRQYLDQNRIQYTSFWIANVMAVEGDRRIVETLARFPGVLLIEPDRAFKADLEADHVDDGMGGFYPSTNAVQPNLSQVHAPEVWARGATGKGIVYAVADTGVYWRHPALISQYRGWNGLVSVHDYSWWDAIHLDINGGGNSCGFSSSIPCDDYGHGTHVTGIGVGDDGGNYQIGMAPDAQWIACRNMDEGVGRPSTYMECFQFFIAPTRLDGSDPRPDLRPDVISNSYSCPESELCTVHSMQLVLEAVRAAGIFMSVSAGNSGPGCESITAPPALEESVYTIGAVGSGNLIASFSSRGPVTVDGPPLMKPNLVAPGVGILSSLPNGFYGYRNGTSMSAPHVAGAVALLWGAFPSLRRDVNATETLLSETAFHITTDESCGDDGPASVPNNTYGWGLLDVKAAYDAYWPIQPKWYLFPIYK